MADYHPPAPPTGPASSNSNAQPEPSAAISTRGQNLPRLIHSRSSAGRPTPTYRVPNAMSLSSKAPFGQRDDQADLELGRRRSHLHDNASVPQPPPGFPLSRGTVVAVERDSQRDRDRDEWRSTVMNNVLMTPQMRSQRLIGNSNPRYQWEQYYKPEEELKPLKKKIRKYYERNNYLLQQYLYIDRLLDSSLPHNLIQEYHEHEHDGEGAPTILEEGIPITGTDSPLEHGTRHSSPGASTPQTPNGNGESNNTTKKLKRNKDIYRIPADEQTPLLPDEDGNQLEHANTLATFQPDADVDSNSRIVSVAIYINFAANTLLLILKIIVTVLTSSLSVLASLVDAALDFLSTFIVWTTTHLISRADADTHNYPVGRRRLEPVGVLVFSVVMITSFFQVAVEAVQRLASPDHTIVQLSPAAVAIMATTVVVKFLCWLWCRLIKNSSVQALAQDAMTDVVFNTFSIIFPLVGYYASIWWLDPLGGLLLSLYVIVAWSRTTRIHILNLTGHAASKDERNILLYLTMRFAHTIEKIQSLSAYHAGDKINVEVDIVLDERMSLRDSHDLGESLQYVLESVPGVERAFVHSDYASKNLPSHMKP